MSVHNKAFLIVEKGIPYYRREVFEVSDKRFIIGRATEFSHPDLSFTSGYISRNHAEIEYIGGSFFICDNSRHGSKVNGICLDKSVPYQLKQDDQIELAGNEASIRFSLKPPSDETIKEPKPEEVEIIFDEPKREIYVGGEQIELSGNLYTLFQLLFQNRRSVVSNVTLKKTVWPERQYDNDVPLVGDEEVVVLVKRLREKLGKYGNLIRNKRGYGYTLK
jgi:DNA-binding winged helix-turn-helix (wHTH) protein